MLKPKKKLTRKEIKRDPFLESIVAFRENIKSNKKLYTRVSIGLMALVILISLYSRNQRTIDSAANFTFAKAMVYTDIGDNDNAILHLQIVIDESGKSEAGITAKYYLGRIYFDQGNYLMAGPLLEQFVKKTSNPILKGPACQALAYVYKKQDDLDSAIQLQEKAIQFANSDEEEAWASLILAELTLLGGNKKGAQDIVDEVLKNWDNNFDLKQKAEEVSGWIYVEGHL